MPQLLTGSAYADPLRQTHPVQDPPTPLPKGGGANFPLYFVKLSTASKGKGKNVGATHCAPTFNF